MNKRNNFKLGIGVFAMLFTILAITVVVCAQLYPRLKISIFRYDKTDSDKHVEKFSNFRGIITDKIVRLSEELEEIDQNLSYLKNLTINFVTDLDSNKHVVFRGSLQDLQNHWQRTGSLEVFRGRIRTDGNLYSVRSKIYLGDLKGHLNEATITVDLPIKDEEFDTTRDTHSAVTLYALAMDARERRRPKTEINALLAEALNRLPEDHENISGMKVLKEAIDQALK
jgi:hypothetical protein